MPKKGDTKPSKQPAVKAIVKRLELPGADMRDPAGRDFEFGVEWVETEAGLWPNLFIRRGQEMWTFHSARAVHPTTSTREEG